MPVLSHLELHPFLNLRQTIIHVSNIVRVVSNLFPLVLCHFLSWPTMSFCGPFIMRVRVSSLTHGTSNNSMFNFVVVYQRVALMTVRQSILLRGQSIAQYLQSHLLRVGHSVRSPVQTTTVLPLLTVRMICLIVMLITTMAAVVGVVRWAAVTALVTPVYPGSRREMTCSKSSIWLGIDLPLYRILLYICVSVCSMSTFIWIMYLMFLCDSAI